MILLIYLEQIQSSLISMLDIYTQTILVLMLQLVMQLPLLLTENVLEMVLLELHGLVQIMRKKVIHGNYLQNPSTRLEYNQAWTQMLQVVLNIIVDVADGLLIIIYMLMMRI